MSENESDTSAGTPEVDPFHDFTVPQDADFATSKDSDGDDIEKPESEPESGAGSGSGE
ncbi:hypothetical protein [Subtercola endophyticus]|uniref:hypothetical protein n=1 Tax=Subtercola endophyticus TaxID=2895559 RepID=UPI001E3EC2BE|nr:hypothetical protein [Subtercola endophyticus]UFS59047.1 hypothetical protein LQ955_19005 [Subtercola endophyticus]